MRRALFLAALLAGCHSNPYCLTCNHGLTGSVDLGAADLAGASPGAPDLAGPCTPTNNSVEICDGLDNDCNGIVDDVNPAQLAADPNNCGACGKVCNFQALHQFGSCVTPSGGTPACVASSCIPGFVDVDPNQPGCEYQCSPTSPTTEVCDGRDNDCDGQIDNGLTPPAGLCATKGVCASVAIAVLCKGAAGWKCDYTSVPGIELDSSGNPSVLETKCDGQDNNCNGVIDLDGFPTLGNACTAGQGACQNSGHIACVSVATAACNVVAAPGNATDEACNGIDDNCDGQIDETTPAFVTMCAGGTRPCTGYHDPMVAIPNPASAGSIYVYRFEASRPDATGGSQGGNSARACSKSGVLPWASVTETQAETACEAVHDSANAPMRLCTSAEWQAACEGPTGAPSAGSSKWSIAPSPSPAPSGVCNDERVNALWATGTVGPGSGASGQQCFTDWGSGQHISDLSGNLTEWTSTQVSSEGNTYFQTHGGSFSTPFAGTSCEYSFVIYPASFVDTNLGFRCCAAHAP